ncbi:hypothetical protein GC163_19745 [bacterium]|nr:hypothetical protein [bacterium]
MHTRTVVLLPHDTPDLWDAGSALLRPHRLVEDDVDRPWRLDYWTAGGESIADEESAAAFGVGGDEELARNVCFVSRLRPNFMPGALVTPDGRWYDLIDHGWRFIDGDTPANRVAEARWNAQVRELFMAHASCVAVEFDTHS